MIYLIFILTYHSLCVCVCLAGIGGATAVAGLLFWILFKKYNALEEEMNKLEDNGEVAVRAADINATGRVT